MKETTYGQRGGQGPTAGKKSVLYRVLLPDGSSATKRSFADHGLFAQARAFRSKSGKIIAGVWPLGAGVPWEGDFGALQAVRED